MDELLKLLIASFATWRMSSLLAREAGPFNMFGRIRIFLFRRTFSNTRLSALYQTLSDGIGCMWCNSVWVSAVVALTLSSNLVQWFTLVMALSAGVIMIEKIMEALDGNSKNKNDAKSG
jgi:hypothetical protein